MPLQLASPQRQRHVKSHIDTWVDRELENIHSLIDAEHSLEQLKEVRATVNSHYNQVKAGVDQKELASIGDELKMRNAQIVDLQQKGCLSDLESRSKSLVERVQCIRELRSVSKQLLKSPAQQAHSLNEQRTAMD
ncbi:Hypothetical predicted protein [Drosophila guanche]|uniref:Uncharacterized protein n=1 Tax=Drosophila guanche TaxID=7266 RepID=A0A3B0K8V7_DROGU|nr:Hypothetical predicted protein [Drosophila guanche]